MLKRLWQKYSAASGAARWYIGAVFVFAIGLVVPWGRESGTNIAAFMIVVGFVLWCVPWAHRMREAWDRPIARVPIVLLHILALLVATVLGRHLVAITLGLPPQTFDLTVGFLAILLYIPAWLIIASVIIPVLGVILVVSGVIWSGAVSLQHQAIYMVSAFGGRIAPWQAKDMLMLHGVGAIFSGVFLLAGYAYLDARYSDWLGQAVKVIAVKSDFYPARNYLGVAEDEYIHPLENGQTAFVRLTPGLRVSEIKIGVRAQ